MGFRVPALIALVMRPPIRAAATTQTPLESTWAFGCNWRDQSNAYVGGSCTVAAGATKTCTLKPPKSNRLHRLVIKKQYFDGKVHSGNVYVR